MFSWRFLLFLGFCAEAEVGQTLLGAFRIAPPLLHLENPFCKTDTGCPLVVLILISIYMYRKCPGSIIVECMNENCPDSGRVLLENGWYSFLQQIKASWFSLLNPMCDKSRWRSSSSSREIKLLLLLHQYDGHISFLRFLKFSFLSWILPLTPSFALNPTSSFIFLPLPQFLGLPTSSTIFSTTIFASSNSFIYLAIRCWLLQNKKDADAKMINDMYSNMKQQKWPLFPIAIEVTRNLQLQSNIKNVYILSWTFNIKDTDPDL